MATVFLIRREVDFEEYQYFGLADSEEAALRLLTQRIAPSIKVNTAREADGSLRVVLDGDRFRAEYLVETEEVHL